MNEALRKAAAKMEVSMMEVMFGMPKKQPQTALRMSGGRFESVELDADGKVIEPPGPCCRGVIVHDPKCPFAVT